MDENSLIFDFEGKGKIKVLNQDNINVDVEISLKKRYNSNMEVVLISKLFFDTNLHLLEQTNQSNLIKCSLIGELNQNKKIHIPVFYINQFSLSMKQGQSPITTIKITPFSEVFIWDLGIEDYTKLIDKRAFIKVGLLNFVFGGKFFTKYPSGESRRDYFITKIEDKELVFKQLKEYDFIEKILKKEKNVMLTSEIEVNNCSLNEMKDILFNLTWLLSYSQKTLISKDYTKLIVDNVEVLVILHNEKKYNFSNSSFVDTSHLSDDDFRLFLEETYINFKSKREKYKLDNIIDIICQAEIAKVLETKYLLLSSAMGLCIEMIKQENNVAVQEDEDVTNNISSCIKKYLDNKNICLSNEDLKEISSKLAFYTLKNKIKSVISLLGFTYSDDEIKRIKNNRNKIVHEVRFADYNNPLKDYELIKLFIDKMMIKLLGYSGNVLNYANKYLPGKIV